MLTTALTYTEEVGRGDRKICAELIVYQSHDVRYGEMVEGREDQCIDREE